MLAELRKIKNKVLEEMVYRMELTFDEIVDTLDKEETSESTTAYTLTSGIYETSDLNLMLKSLHPLKSWC